MCTSAGQGGQLGRFALGPTLLGLPKRLIYSNRTVKSFIKAVIILWGGPTFISCPALSPLNSLGALCTTKYIFRFITISMHTVNYKLFDMPSRIHGA